jgi:hypothetical protein
LLKTEFRARCGKGRNDAQPGSQAGLRKSAQPLTFTLAAMSSIPRVFIVESLRFSDEENDLFEGRFLSQMLTLSGAPGKYVYLRTKAELEEVLDQFEDSQFRYLHFSCHGNSKGIALTLDHLSFKELGELLAPCIKKRRVFFSSCKVANARLAEALLPGTECYSVIGPSKAIEFDRAAIFWASFYHLMLRDEAKSMKHSQLENITSSLQTLFGLHMRYFQASRAASTGFREVPLGS